MFVTPDDRAEAEAAPSFAFRVPGKDAPRLSVVIPMHDEEGNAAALVAEVAAALSEGLPDVPFEILAVDDASRDGTRAALEAAKGRVPGLRVLAHGRNAGQSRAVRTGVLAARAPIVATLDGDGQNPPADIPSLYRALTRQDAPPLLVMVAGERQGRQDSRAKLVASRWANALRKRLLNDESSDTGCGLKVFSREAFLRLPYFDHLHRYLPALMRREGFTVESLPVGHRARRAGVSKYTNLSRAAVAVRDLMGVTWLIARCRQPGTVEEV
jgi:dolichol-phosphate mannosyltransferase